MTTTSSIPPLTNPLKAIKGSQIVTPDLLLSLPKLNLERSTVKWLNHSILIYSFQPTNRDESWQINAFNIETNQNSVLGKGHHPLPSPDGKFIAYISGEGADKQLWMMDLQTLSTKPLTSIEKGLGIYQHTYCFAWSLDSTQIVLCHGSAQDECLFDVITVSTGQSETIYRLRANVRYLSALPNRHEFIFQSERIGFQCGEPADNEWVHAIDIKKASLRPLFHIECLQQFLAPAASPDGKRIALTMDVDNPVFNFMLSLTYIDARHESAGPVKLNRVTEEMKLSSPLWSADSAYLYALRDYGAYKQLYRFNPTTREARQITDAPLNIESYALSPDGLNLAWIGQDSQATQVLRMGMHLGTNPRDLAVARTTTPDISLSEVREIEWQANDYPTPVRGLLFMPLHYNSQHAYPLIIDIHGGDAGSRLQLFGGLFVNSPLEWHMWAAQGYAVFVPDFRSSASFGSLAITRDLLKNHDRLTGDLSDIEAGVNYLIQSGLVDKHRMAIIGHSAGGLRANWFAVKSHRYRAIISKEGWADEFIQANLIPNSKRILEIYGGSPEVVPENYVKNSPSAHTSDASTPILFLMGNPELGGIDAGGTVNTFYQRLKQQGVETEIIYYPDEGHVFENNHNLRDMLERVFTWLKNTIPSTLNKLP